MAAARAASVNSLLDWDDTVLLIQPGRQGLPLELLRLQAEGPPGAGFGGWLDGCGERAAPAGGTPLI